jgi:uncharacterized protein YqfA (UPF0365 family)
MMRRGGVFWAVVLILIGALLLADNMGLFEVNVWQVIWPVALIALGVWVLVGPVMGMGRRQVISERAVIPLQGAEQARVRVHHGAGRLQVDASAGPGELVNGTFAGLVQHVRREGATLDVDMRMDFQWGWGWRWRPGGTLDWTFGLNGAIPLALEFDTGASEAHLDLTDLRVTDLVLRAGASSTEVTLPAHAGHTRANIRAGAAYMRVRVPSGVAARLRVKSAVADVNVDQSRFPRRGNVYQSADYETAENKVEIDMEAGVGALDVR